MAAEAGRSGFDAAVYRQGNGGIGKKRLQRRHWEKGFGSGGLRLW